MLRFQSVTPASHDTVVIYDNMLPNKDSKGIKYPLRTIIISLYSEDVATQISSLWEYIIYA